MLERKLQPTEKNENPQSLFTEGLRIISADPRFAFQNFKRIVELNTDLVPEAYLELAHLSSSTAIFSRKESISYQFALDAYLARANRYQQEGQSQLAINDFNVLINFKTSFNCFSILSSIHAKKAEEHEKLGEQEKAAHEFFCGGYYASMMGKTDEAIALYTRAIQLNPHLIDAYYYRAVEFVELSQYDKARHDCDAVLKLLPTHFYALALSKQLNDEDKEKKADPVFGELAKLLEQAMLRPRSDRLQYTLPRNIIHWIWKANDKDQLMVNNKRVKKLRLIYTDKLAYPNCCIAINFVDGTKIVCSLKQPSCVKVAEILKSLKAYRDEIAVQAGESEKINWSQDYINIPTDQPKDVVPDFYRILRAQIASELELLLLKEKIESVVLIEPGCGHANLLAECIKRCEKNKIKVELAIGVDLNEVSIQKARAKHLTADKNNLVLVEGNNNRIDEIVKKEMQQRKIPNNTKIIAVCSGSISRMVLSSIDQAIDVFKKLNEIGADFILVSGWTESLINSTTAKKAEFKLSRVISNANLRDIYLFRKMTPQEIKAWQEKRYEEFYGTWVDREVMLSASSRFFDRLRTPDPFDPVANEYYRKPSMPS